MKIAMVSFAHMHAYSYAEHVKRHAGAEISAVWDEDVNRGSQAAARYGVPFYEDLHELLASDVDAVIVCSENARHKDHVVAAARAGKHILCEKPMALEIADAMEMNRVCEENGVILQIAYPVRYSPAIRSARNWIQDGQLGDMIAINATNHGKMPGGWFVDPQLSGGGAAVDHIVHVMDIMFWVLDDKVVRVHAELETRLHDIAVEDCGMVLLETQSGVIAAIDPSWSRPAAFPVWGDLIMEFIGTRGTMRIDLNRQVSVFYNDTEHKIEHLPWMDDLDEELIHDFIDIVKQGKPASISGSDGLRTLEVVKAAYMSHHLQRAIVL
jgi:UDP-N-acetylglucosamine 3-dehydrogenase